MPTNTVTVNNQQIRCFELWNPNTEEITHIVLHGHWDGPVAIAAVRTYLEGPIAELLDESPYGTCGIGTEDNMWANIGRIPDQGYGRWRQPAPNQPEAEVFDWSDEPADGFEPVTKYFVAG